MKTLNESFSNGEFEALERAKKASKAKNWHDFILESAGVLPDDQMQGLTK